MITFLKQRWQAYQSYKKGLKAPHKITYYIPEIEFLLALIGLKATHKIRYNIVYAIETLTIALVIALLIKTYIIQVSVVPSGSMIPTMIGGVSGTFNDRLFVSKFTYVFTTPQRGDIVVFRSPAGDGIDYVKRCVGLPGDVVEIKRGVVYINDQELILAGVDIQRDYSYFGPIQIPADHYFMLGDNRAHSRDSRSWGFVPDSDLVGKALFTFWPFTRLKPLR